MTNEQIQAWIEHYHLGEMSVEEREHFEASMQESAELRRLYREHKAFVRMVNHKAAKDLVSAQLASIKQEQSSTIRRISNSMQVHVNRYWKIASVAASVALISSVGTMMFSKSYYKNAMTSELLSLNRKMSKEDREIKAEIKELKGQLLPEQPKGSAQLTGTCFAINNNGYAVTNAHVVNEGTSVYVFTQDNVAHKASIVSKNNELDIAVLKIDEPDFKFSKVNDVPYSLGNYTSDMAQDVYTLGFPKNSIVYNRGYVSSAYGRNDDSSHYQLELPSSPGVSGSPVFDNKGNVVAIINSKESVGGGITYALKSNKLKQYLNDADSIKMNSGTKMQGHTASEQIKLLQDFVLVVKVY
jgi:serine protease Do